MGMGAPVEPASPSTAGAPDLPQAPAYGRTLGRQTPVSTILAVAVVAVAAVIVAVVLSKGSHHATPAVAAFQPAAAAAPAEPATTPAAQPVSSSAVESLLSEYASDYSNEDSEGLESLFAESLVRQDGSHAAEDRQQALATYRHQFSQLTTPVYTLSGLNIEPGAGGATASGQYRISSNNGVVHGEITFHLVEQGGQLLIDGLTIEPSQ
jgi:hypothetical protein